tara:strand:- start:331 stop:972 length:642 start_codon:yes stop_codon:yes gene_type:complete
LECLAAFSCFEKNIPNTLIPLALLKQYGATKREISAQTVIFLEGDAAHTYFQIVSGNVKMFNTNLDGKEFVQGMFEAGQSFGEPPLFQSSDYPASAQAMSNTTLYALPKDQLFKLLKDHFDVHLAFTAMLTKRLMYKSMILREISSHDAKHRILTLIDHLKSEYGQPSEKMEVNLTRQQISELLGIRVETVIRTVKQLEKEGEIEIKERKILR